MTRRDIQITAAFLRSTRPTSFHDLVAEWGISAKQARRYFNAWHKAGIASPRGYRGRAPTWGPKE